MFFKDEEENGGYDIQDRRTEADGKLEEPAKRGSGVDITSKHRRLVTLRQIRKFQPNTGQEEFIKQVVEIPTHHPELHQADEILWRGREL